MLARLCTNQKNKYLNEACVYLYRLMGWYEESVDLALQLNVDIAREIADSVGSDLTTTTSINDSNLDELKKSIVKLQEDLSHENPNSACIYKEQVYHFVVLL